jgi:glycine/D-amino acid oxidase-like deaminating enzyme
MSRQTVIIVGGGLAGLSAAHTVYEVPMIDEFKRQAFAFCVRLRRCDTLPSIR